MERIKRNSTAIFNIISADLILDSLISYLNQQDWSYLKAKNDWSWHGDIIIIFNKKGFVKRVRSDFHSGYTHQDDIYLQTADREVVWSRGKSLDEAK